MELPEPRKRIIETMCRRAGSAAAAMSLAGALLGCGGGGAADVSAAVEPNITNVDTSGVRAVAGRPGTAHSGLVRYEGVYYSLDPDRPTPPNRALLDEEVRVCNYIRQITFQLPPQTPDVAPDVLTNADRSTEVLGYDSLSGASRHDKRHVRPKLVEGWQIAKPPQCNQVELYYTYSTKIIAADGYTYVFVYDYKSGELLRIEGHLTKVLPALRVPWSNDWARRTIAGEECVQMPRAGDGTFGSERCNWSAFPEVQFWTLPIALEQVNHLGTAFHHRITAVLATADLSTFAEWGTLRVDELPRNVPVVIRTDPPPTDSEESEKSGVREGARSTRSRP